MFNSKSRQNNPVAISHESRIGKKRFYNKKGFKVIVGILLVLALVGGVFAWRAGKLLNKISTNGNIFGSIAHMVPGINNDIKGEKDGRINILLLGMRGADDPNGGNLADSSMVISINTKDNKISMISIPRDLYVKDIENDGSSKINAIYQQGLSKGGAQKAITDAEQKYGEVAGVPIHYTVTANYQAFTDLVNAMGGVPINLSKPFEESAQFNQMGVCDGVTFTKPSGQFQNKIEKHIKQNAAGVAYVVKTKVPKYPLCYNEHPECNGDFKLPAGPQTLDAATALCFARSRDNSSDFDRAKRQQMILQALKSKALSLGTLTDFNKLNGIFNSLGNNISTDLQGWEMKKLYDIYMTVDKANPKIIQRVLENTDEGLLYTPPENPATGYILLPRGDNYDQIHQLFQNTFTAPAQSDIDVIQ